MVPGIKPKALIVWGTLPIIEQYSQFLNHNKLVLGTNYFF